MAANGLVRRLNRATYRAKEMEDGIWVVSFMDYDLGYFDERGSRVEPVDDPFGFQKV